MGFYFSDETSGHLEAMELVKAYAVVSNDAYCLVEEEYSRIFPSEDDLRVMPDNSTTRLALKSFQHI